MTEENKETCENCVHSRKLYMNPDSVYLACDLGIVTMKDRTCEEWEGTHEFR